MSAQLPGAAERIIALSAAKRAIVARHLRRSGSAMEQPPPQPRNAGLTTFPLSFAQERLWFLENVAPGRSVYNVTGALRLTGHLDVDALVGSLRQLAIRHEALRTVVPASEGRAVQVVCSVAPVVPRMHDLRDAPPHELEASIAEQAHRPFDLALGPLWRSALFRMDADTHVLAVTLHHLVADAWSVRVLVEELVALYAARTTGEAGATLPSLAFQYADFAVWQRGQVERGALAGALTFWSKELGGRPVWECPLDRPRPPVPSFQGAVETRSFPGSLTSGIERLGATAGATPFMILFAAFAVVLSRWSASREVCVLSPTSNRDGPGLDRCVGFLVNVLALRVPVALGATFAELVGLVRDKTLRAFAHQHVPFELVVASLGHERRIDRAPVSTVAFAVEAERADRWVLSGLDVALEETQRRTVETDLLLTVRYGGAVPSARLEYSQELFDPATIRGVLVRYESVLAWMLDHPDRAMADLPGEHERRVAATPRSGDTGASRVVDGASLLEGFARQVDAAPTRTVVVDASGRGVTYAALEREAAAIASALQEHGAERGTVVGVLGRRTPDFVAALLGSLQAGCAFLPIDPEAPALRLRQMVSESAARFLVADEAHAAMAREIAPAHEACAVLTMDDVRRVRRSTPRHVSVSPRDLAYVLFTSGSAGKPKGAMIEHRGLRNHLHAKIAFLGLTATDRVAQTAPSSFDVAVWQWLAPLLVGASVEIVDDADARDPERLIDALERRAISIGELVPSLLRAVLDEIDRCHGAEPRLVTLRKLIVTGESLSPALCRRWLERYPHVPLVNAYGPTECSDDVTHYQVDTPPPAGEVRVPIGWPIDNVRLYVDDGGIVPVRAGSRGELCVGGAAVGRGYVNDPERTASAFIADIWSDEEDARIYRTGDLVHVRDDGSLEWLGRIDRQVKVAGCRIELDEIEATLTGHSEIRDAAVVAVPAKDGALRLTAYVVPAGGARSSREWRTFLAERLPAQMVPCRVVTVEALPLTTNLKIDRDALRDTALADPEDSTPAEPAQRSRAEEILGAIWQDLLGRREIGRDDDFFELGGDSILSIQVSARARRAGLSLRARDVFEHPTIARLAGAARWESHRPAQRGLVVGPVPLAPSQAAFFARQPVRPEECTMAVALEVAGSVDPALLSAALERLTLHHDALRLRFTRSAECWTQYCALPKGGIPIRRIEVGDGRARSWRSALRAAEATLRRDLDLGSGPLAAVAFLEDRAHARTVLGIVAHHLACDTVSAHVLVEDLELAYVQLAAGLDVALPRQTTAFRDWCEYLVEYADSTECLTQIPFWLRQVADVGSRRRCDPAREPNERSRIRTVTMRLDGASTARLRGSSEDTSMRSVLLAAFLCAVEPVITTPSVVVQIESHARAEVGATFDLSRSVGWFACGHPIAFARSALRSLSGAIEHVRERLEEVPAHGIGYGALRHLARDEAVDGLRRAPDPDLAFNYLGTVGGRPGGLLTPVRMPRPSEAVRARGDAPALEMITFVVDGCLHLTAAYRDDRYRRGTIDRLTSRMVASLGTLATQRRPSA